jgi:hypothetical protein
MFNGGHMTKDYLPGYEFPDTAEKRRAGMASFRAQMLAAHERTLASGKLSKRDAEFTRSIIATIKAKQGA